MNLCVKISNQFRFQRVEGRALFRGLGAYSRARLLDISMSRVDSPWNFSHSSIFPSAIKRLESPGWMGINTRRLIAEWCFPLGIPGLFEEPVTTRGTYWLPYIFKTTIEIDFRTTVDNHTEYRSRGERPIRQQLSILKLYRAFARG